jgi:hypothetical protein
MRLDVDETRILPKAEAAKILRRAGYRSDQIDAIFSELPDPIDLDRDGAILQQRGVTRDHLVSLMGGSP